MPSLRWFHLLFILFVIMGADVFGVWAIRYARAAGDVWMMVLGVTTIVGGLGLIAYALALVRKFDRSGIR